jgi:DNA-binding CsgD family transcriptional regulator
MNINLDEFTIEELKAGYYYDGNAKAYHCLLCSTVFEEGEVFHSDDRFFEASRAIQIHIEKEHGGMFRQLLASDSKYNTLTDKQIELFELIHNGLTDSEIASRLGISASTVRHQRFSFREKAKQAKLYLSLYELAQEGIKTEKDRLVPIHNGARMVDERFVITEEEREKTLATVFSSFDPLKLKLFSSKEKKKIITLQKIMEQFEKGRTYPEKEINTVLKGIYEDYPTLRRYLIEYGFMVRSKDCKEYWVI